MPPPLQVIILYIFEPGDHFCSDPLSGHPNGTPIVECTGLLFLAAVAARRFGARDFVTDFLKQLAAKAALFRQTLAGKMGQFLEEIAMNVASRMRQRAKVPVTRAHLPHSAVANTREGNACHFKGVDWKYLALITPVAAATLCSTSSSTGMADFVHVGSKPKPCACAWDHVLYVHTRLCILHRCICTEAPN
jgi:hypothetical protein